MGGCKGKATRFKDSSEKLKKNSVSDVGDKVILVTLWWWQFQGWQLCYWHCYDTDYMTLTDFRCWWRNHYVGDFSNVFNQSSTSWIGHEHLKLVINTFCLQHPSPTSISPQNLVRRLTFHEMFKGWIFHLLCIHSFSPILTRFLFHLNFRESREFKVGKGYFGR